MYIRFYVKYPLFCSATNETLIFSTCFSSIQEISNLKKSVQRERGFSMWTDGQTDRLTDEQT